MVVHSNYCLNLYPFIFFDPLCDLDKGVVGSDISCLVSCLGDDIGYLGCPRGFMEDLVVVQLLL